MAPAIQAERQAPAPSVDPNNIPPSPEPDPTLPNAVPAIPGVNPVQQAQPAVDLKTGKLPALGDVEQKTAEEYSKRIDPARSYKVDIAREDGVVLRGAGYFHKTAGDDATGGAFSEGQNGVRYHNTGTTEDGRVLARHSVAPNGEVRMRPYEAGPRVFPSEITEVINQLGLTSGENGVHSRRGFTGEYKIQIESDKTFSIHYAGGFNSAGERCYSQTYHHGRWDNGRGASLASVSPKDQEVKWARWRAREDGDATSVSVAHSQPVAKSGSGFHSATGSTTANEEGKLSKTEKPLTTEEQQKGIARITKDKSSWSGTYVRVAAAEQGQPDIVPPTFSFSCQHNDQSGILNIKQTTLGTAPDVVRMTYGLAINHNNEVANNNQGFRSLLTDTEMLLDEGNDKQTIVKLCANGDVIAGDNIFRIQVKEGEPISWVQRPFNSAGTSELLERAPAPSAAPDLNGTTSNTPTLTNEQKTTARDANLEKVSTIATDLLNSGSTSKIHVDPSIEITHASSTADRTAISAAVKVTDEGGDAYAFSRRVKTPDRGDQGGILFVKESELTHKDRTIVQDMVHQAYEAAHKNGAIQIEKWFPLVKENTSNSDKDTYARVRSDGSVECKYVAHSADTEAAPATPTLCQILVPISADAKDPNSGIKWDVIDCTWNADTNRAERTVTRKPAATTTTETKKTTVETAPVPQKAQDLAKNIYQAMYLNLNDDEEAFVKLVEAASKQGLIKEVNNELYRMHGKTIRGIMAEEGASSWKNWAGISQAHIDRLEKALNGFNEAPTSKYEPPEYKPSDDSGPMMMM